MEDWGYFVLGLVIVGFVIHRSFIEIGIINEAYKEKLIGKNAAGT